jgi:hypothetical protein
MLDKQIDGKIRQFKRIAMSFADFKDAVDMSKHIIVSDLHADFEKHKLVLCSLNCSMIIAYCRPFSGNDSRNIVKVPDLSSNSLKVLSPIERKMHDYVIGERNTLLAHSDSLAVDLKFVINQYGEHRMLQPIRNWNLAPMTIENVKVFNATALKLLSYVATKRAELEPEMINILREEDIDHKW